MESIKQILLYLNTLSASAPFVAVVVTGTLGFLFFKMPRGGIQFINTMFTVRFAVNNGGYGENQEAIYRPGRVDKCILIDALDLPNISNYIKMVFPDYSFELPVSDIRIPGSKLQELFQSNKRDPDNFVQEVSAILRGEKPAVVLLEAI